VGVGDFGKPAHEPGIISQYPAGQCHPRVRIQATRFRANPDPDPAAPNPGAKQHPVEREASGKALGTDQTEPHSTIERLLQLPGAIQLLGGQLTVTRLICIGQQLPAGAKLQGKNSLTQG
jgi:hypothetical protein